MLAGTLFSLSLKIFPEKNFFYFFLEKTYSEEIAYIFWKKVFLIFQEWNVLASGLRNFLYFRREFSKVKKLKKNRSEKISYIFSKTVFLIFWEMELSSPKLKRLLIFQEGTFRAWKKKRKPSEKISYISWNGTF